VMLLEFVLEHDNDQASLPIQKQQEQ